MPNQLQEELRRAVETSDLDEIHKLLTKGADPSLPYFDHFNAIELAIRARNVEALGKIHTHNPRVFKCKKSQTLLQSMSSYISFKTKLNPEHDYLTFALSNATDLSTNINILNFLKDKGCFLGLPSSVRLEWFFDNIADPTRDGVTEWLVMSSTKQYLEGVPNNNNPVPFDEVEISVQQVKLLSQYFHRMMSAGNSQLLDVTLAVCNLIKHDFYCKDYVKYYEDAGHKPVYFGDWLSCNRNFYSYTGDETTWLGSALTSGHSSVVSVIWNRLNIVDINGYNANAAMALCSLTSENLITLYYELEEKFNNDLFAQFVFKYSLLMGNLILITELLSRNNLNLTCNTEFYSDGNYSLPIFKMTFDAFEKFINGLLALAEEREQVFEIIKRLVQRRLLVEKNKIEAALSVIEARITQCINNDDYIHAHTYAIVFDQTTYFSEKLTGKLTPESALLANKVLTNSESKDPNLLSLALRSLFSMDLYVKDPDGTLKETPELILFKTLILEKLKKLLIVPDLKLIEGHLSGRLGNTAEAVDAFQAILSHPNVVNKVKADAALHLTDLMIAGDFEIKTDGIPEHLALIELPIIPPDSNADYRIKAESLKTLILTSRYFMILKFLQLYAGENTQVDAWIERCRIFIKDPTFKFVEVNQDKSKVFTSSELENYSQLYNERVMNFLAIDLIVEENARLKLENVAKDEVIASQAEEIKRLRAELEALKNPKKLVSEGRLGVSPFFGGSGGVLSPKSVSSNNVLLK